MKYDLYQDSYANMRLSLRVLLFVVLGLCVLSIALVVAYFRASHRVQYVLIPPVMTDKVYVGTEAIDKRYLTAMGVYVTDLLGSYTPFDVEHRKAQLLSLAAPEIYQKVREKLDKWELTVKAERVNQVFTPTDIRVSTLKKKVKEDGKWRILSPSEGVIEARGVASRKIGLGAPLWKNEVIIRVNYRFRNGLFQLTGFNVHVTPENKVLRKVMEEEAKKKAMIEGKGSGGR